MFASHEHDDAVAADAPRPEAESMAGEVRSVERAPTPLSGRVHGRVARAANGPAHDPLGGGPIPAPVAATLARRRGGGAPLSPALAEPMGDLLGTDLRDVRVHTDGEANRVSHTLQADAFTFGRDVYFARGRFDPGTSSGQHLLAHELAHVAQGDVAGASATVGRADDPAEVAADRAADQVVGRLRRHAAVFEEQQAGAAMASTPGDRPATLRRHGSPEHLILGNIGPRDIRRIPDAKELLKTLGIRGLGNQDKAAVREAIHVVLQERQRVRDMQGQGVGRGDPQAAEAIFQVKIVSLDNDLKNGAPGPTLPVLATYGEMNTLADYFGSVEDLNAVSNDTMHKVLQTEREDYYNYLGSLFKELTEQDFITRTYTVTVDGRPTEVSEDYYRPENWYQGNLNAIFSSQVGYTVTNSGRLTSQRFQGTQSGVLTAGVASWAAGMHGIDTVIDADPGTQARQGGGVWGATARNACHFAPQSWHAWKKYHLKARELALEAYRLKAFAGVFNGERAEDAAAAENDAWVNNGFGDHYLQDSFASGHLINKTLVMQWYLEFINDNWWAFGPSREEWSRLMGMTTDRQPLLSGRAQYDKSIDVEPSGPQAITGGQTGHQAFETADLVNPVTPQVEVLLKWWRAQIAQDPEKQAMRRTELLQAPHVNAALVDELVKLPMVLDQGKPYSSYVPYFGTDDRVYKLNESPGMSQAKAGTGQAYDAGESLTYAEYAEFMKNSLLQSGSGDLHNYFCKNGLDVENDEGDVIFRIYGDYVMLTEGGGQGVEISGATAEMSRTAISDIVSRGRSPITVEQIMARFPSKAAIPTKIYDVEIGETSPTETLPLDKWHEQLHPMLTKIFTKGSKSIKDRAVWLLSRAPTKTQLTSMEHVVPHAGSEF